MRFFTMLMPTLFAACGSIANVESDAAPADPDAPAAAVCGDGVVSGAERCEGESPLCAACVTQDVTFAFTGAVETVVVPAGVTELRVTVIGASGGGSVSCDVDPPVVEADGGLAAVVLATLPVTPGDTLMVRVGGQGGSGVLGDENSVADGGYNGGGTGGYYGAGGGGGSDLRIGGDALADRVLVAGGGGGGNSGCPNTGSGGDSGTVGASGMAFLKYVPGGGGGETAGGTAGSEQTPGEFGLGGSWINSAYHVGAGGGGYYGGGAAFAAGGGGGSSFTSADATAVNVATAAARADGSVIITVP